MTSKCIIKGYEKCCGAFSHEFHNVKHVCVIANTIQITWVDDEKQLQTSKFTINEHLEYYMA